jgi:hypothetical protein
MTGWLMRDVKSHSPKKMERTEAGLRLLCTRLHKKGFEAPFKVMYLNYLLSNIL